MNSGVGSLGFLELDLCSDLHMNDPLYMYIFKVATPPPPAVQWHDSTRVRVGSPESGNDIPVAVNCGHASLRHTRKHPLHRRNIVLVVLPL